MPNDRSFDPDTPIVGRIRWGRVTASIPIHIGYLWPFLKDGDVMFAGRETDPVFIGLPLAVAAFGLLGLGVGPALTAWWKRDTDRFASLVPSVRQMQEALRTSERLTLTAGEPMATVQKTLHRASDIDRTGEAQAKLQALGVYFGRRSAPTPADFGRLIDCMERRDLKGARKRWPKADSTEPTRDRKRRS